MTSFPTHAYAAWTGIKEYKNNRNGYQNNQKIKLETPRIKAKPINQNITIADTSSLPLLIIT